MHAIQISPISSTSRQVVGVLLLFSFMALVVNHRAAVAQLPGVENNRQDYDDFPTGLDAHEVSPWGASPVVVRGQDGGILGLGGLLSRRGAPSLEEPGPDSPDFPDSAFTVAPGVVYFETSLTYESSKGVKVRAYFTDTLIRVGL